MNKRGISSIVATVLIILITVAAISMIWVFVLPMIKENLSFDETTDLSISTEGGYTAYSQINHQLAVQVKRGADNAQIAGAEIVLICGGESSKVRVAPVPDQNQARTYYINTLGCDNLSSIKIFPVFRKGDTIKTGVVTGALENLPLVDIDFGSHTLISLGADQIANSCVEDWNCTGWSNCINGQKTRTCIDNNNCGTTLNKGPEQKSCICNETLDCGAWVDGGCVSLSQRNQTRTCEQGCESFPSSRLVDDSSCSPLNSPNLVSYWHMDGDGSDSKGSNPLSIAGATFVPARMGQGLFFNGTTSSYSNASMFTLYGNSFAILSWFKSSEANNDGKIFSTSTSVHEFQVYQGKIRFCIGSCVAGSSLINDSNWHFAAVVGNSSGIYAFLDGNKNPEASRAVYTASISGFARVGAIGGGMTQPYSAVSYTFKGTIDELMVFNSSLSADEIQRVYNGQK